MLHAIIGTLMFERYTEPARRAIFYARAIMLIEEDQTLDAIHMLRGLMRPTRSRIEVLFHLRERLPQYCEGPKTSTMVATKAPASLPLTEDAKKILFFAAKEADAMGDAWVDTDHLLLGILCVPGSIPAEQLSKAGIVLEMARNLAKENRSSRPDYGPIIPLGKSPSPSVWLSSKWHWWNARRSEKRFVMQRQK